MLLFLVPSRQRRNRLTTHCICMTQRFVITHYIFIQFHLTIQPTVHNHQPIRFINSRENEAVSLSVAFFPVCMYLRFVECSTSPSDDQVVLASIQLLPIFKIPIKILKKISSQDPIGYRKCTFLFNII